MQKFLVVSRWCCLVIFWGISLCCYAELKLPSFFTDHMVLQREKDIFVWGEATPYALVNVALGEQQKETSADSYGRWKVKFSPLSAGGPYKMFVKSGNESLWVNDILIGEVWLCSGQSNMEFPLKAAQYSEIDIKKADCDKIRLFTVEHAMSHSPEDDLVGDWKVCSSQTVGEFSAVGFYYGKELYDALNVPVGLIHSSWGGTDIESWMSMETMDTFPKYKKLMKYLRVADFESLLQEGKKLQVDFEKAVKEEPGLKEKWFEKSYSKADWKVLKVPGLWNNEELIALDGVVWMNCIITIPDSLAGHSAVLSLGQIDDDDITWLNGILVGETKGYDKKRIYTIPEGVLRKGQNELTIRITDTHGNGGCYGDKSQFFLQIQDAMLSLPDTWNYRIAVNSESFNIIQDGPNTFPSRLYNAMIHPLVGYGIRGVIWYQGENNAPRAGEYYKLFPAMINDWRNAWKDSFPFYWVQLANYMQPNSIPMESSWATLRDAQTSALLLPQTGQAVIIDSGDANDIHPKNKRIVGHRLALWALHYDYGMNVNCASPMISSVKRLGNRLRLTFSNVARGLKVHDKYGYVCGIAIAGVDRRYLWAKGYIISENEIEVWNDNVILPCFVRYAWADNPVDANLYNSEGLPVTPFQVFVK